MALNIHSEIKKNKRKTFVLMSMFILFILLIGIVISIIFDPSIITNERNQNSWFNLVSINVIFLLVTFGYIFWFFKQGDKLILKTTGATPVSKKDFPHIYHSVESLSIAAGLKKAPDCYIIDDSALNAYATGVSEEKSHVVLTTGIIKALNREEIEGVIAHELAHIKNGDMRYMLFCAGIIGVFQLLGTFFWYLTFFSSGREDGRLKAIYFGLWLFFSIIAPFFALLLKLAISRNREYLADSSAVKYTRYPKGLANALRRISNDPDPLVDRANKATAHLFISTPFRNKQSFFVKLFSTHPPIESRIRALEGK